MESDPSINGSLFDDDSTGFHNETGFYNDTGFYNESGYFNVSGMSDDGSESGVISLNFIDSFVKALSVMIVSELGDKTFFLAGKC